MDDVLDGVKTWLFPTRWEAALVVIETERSVTIPRLADIDTADITSRKFPMLEMLPETTDPSYRGDGLTDYDAWDNHTIIMLFSMVGSDPKTVEYDLIYCRKALMRIVRVDPTFGGAFNRVRLGQTQYYQMVKSQQTGQLLQVLRQSLQVRTLQR